MKPPENFRVKTRREFLNQVGQGTLMATLGAGLAAEMGLVSAHAGESEAGRAEPVLEFGPLERLAGLMQETPVKDLMGRLAGELKAGTALKDLVAAGALANARTFGGEDYVGFHTVMAHAPAYHMALEMPAGSAALPVFKVLYRNTARIQEMGGRKSEVLHAVQPVRVPEGQVPAEWLREAVRRKDVLSAEQSFAAMAQANPEDAFNDLLHSVQDHSDVHRVVLPYRSWDLLGLIGMEQAHTLLRQSVRYCVKAESWGGGASYDEPKSILPKMMDEYKLAGRAPGTRRAEDPWIDEFSRTIFKSTPAQAAAAAASALAEGISPGDIGEAITLAANQLILRDLGRRPQEEVMGKPPGSVHGDSIGVHACDSANAWRNMARVANPRNSQACLILGAYQVALDRVSRGGDFLNWEPLPVAYHVKRITASEAPALLSQADEAIRSNLQGHAAAAIFRYGELGHDPAAVFGLMRGYAISEDGALHAEKFYRTVTEEFNTTRQAFRWRHLVALARVTASEYGRPAAGVAEAVDLLKS